MVAKHNADLNRRTGKGINVLDGEIALWEVRFCTIDLLLMAFEILNNI